MNYLKRPNDEGPTRLTTRREGLLGLKNNPPSGSAGQTETVVMVDEHIKTPEVPQVPRRPNVSATPTGHEIEPTTPSAKSADQPRSNESAVPSAEQPKKPAILKADSTGKVADPFDDLDALRCDQTFERSGTAIKQITRVPVRKPKKLDWYRVNPDPAYMMQVHLLENKDETETYLVTPSMATELDGEPTLHRYMLFTAVNRNKAVFIFHVQMQEPDGKWNSWHRSQNEAAEFGMREWARMISNKDIGGYDLLKAPPGYEDPDWSKLPPFNVLIKVAFRDFYIDVEHTYVKRLRGEA